MEWMEAIRLQAPVQGRDSLRQALCEELSGMPREPGLEAVRLLQDINVENELTLVLYWDTDVVVRHGSELATHLTRRLAELGLVHRVTLTDVSNFGSVEAGLDRKDGDRRS